MLLTLYISEKPVKSWPIFLPTDKTKSWEDNVTIRQAITNEAIDAATEEFKDELTPDNHRFELTATSRFPEESRLATVYSNQRSLYAQL